VELTNFKSADGQGHEVRLVDEVVGAARGRAYMVGRRKDQDDGDVLVELDHLLHVELVLTRLLLSEVEVLQKELQAR